MIVVIDRCYGVNKQQWCGLIKSSQSLVITLNCPGLVCETVKVKMARLFQCEIGDDRWAEELEEAVRNYESKYLANSGLGQYELYSLLLLHQQQHYAHHTTPHHTRLSYQARLTLTCNWTHSPLVIDLSGHNTILICLWSQNYNQTYLPASLQQRNNFKTKSSTLLFRGSELKYQRQHQLFGNFKTVSALLCQDKYNR